MRLGCANEDFTSWKTWERGAPQTAVEIISNSDRSDTPWEEKLARYHEMGVQELVLFDADASAGQEIRIWNRIEGDLVEREMEAGAVWSEPLGLYWVLAPALE